MKLRTAAVALALALGLFVGVAALAVGSSYIPDDCGAQPCTCFIQLGDAGDIVKGIVRLLVERGYLDGEAQTSRFTEETERAAMLFQAANGLPVTGTMDDDTLTLLVWGVLPEELDARMPVDRGRPETYPDMVYVPTDGGKKRHFDPECSGMLDPRKVSIRNAARLGYDACKKCEADREALLHLNGAF